ncbi:hypothetical protein SpAn4DRAFT_0150 [Sporomusa ovata]|uniref:Uncharacterized protein n=1 Tax=Sporomusa ovata TaxID=2378 RepID=A0A0U1L1Y1_9FIRM|nr:hypothetical protein SpAn4DRAFT_0150 [Sporomusa ovata]
MQKGIFVPAIMQRKSVNTGFLFCCLWTYFLFGGYSFKEIVKKEVLKKFTEIFY